MLRILIVVTFILGNLARLPPICKWRTHISVNETGLRKNLKNYVEDGDVDSSFVARNLSSILELMSGIILSPAQLLFALATPQRKMLERRGDIAIPKT